MQLLNAIGIAINALLRGPLLNLRHWFRHCQVVYHHPNALISFPIVFRYDNISAIKLGDNVVIGSFSEIVVETKSPFSNVPGQLTIGNRVAIGSHANIRAAGGEIYIGENTLIGQHVSLIASNHQFCPGELYCNASWDESKTGIFIGTNVWLGANTTVLPGCSIGNNSVVGAGSVVTKSIPENEVWVGVPARRVRNIELPEETRLSAQSSQL